MKKFMVSMVVVLALSSLTWGEDTVTPPATSGMFIKHSLKVVPHKFFDTQNRVSFMAVAISIGLDGYTTSRDSGFGYREMNPVARPFVRTNAGTGVYFGGSLALLVGGEALLHRTGHHRLERLAPWFVTALESSWAASNLKNHYRVTGGALPNAGVTCACEATVTRK